MPDKDKHFADNAGILKKIKSVLGLNIGTMLFGALFLYMLFSVVLYLTSSNIESYLVIAGPLSRNETYTGLAIRTEKYIRQRQGDMSVIMPGKVARLMPTAWYMVSAVHRRQNRLLN